jgi:xanthine dehydrogenase/oxidase
MVMNMYSLLKENSKPTKQQIEDSFDGNLCRCTGYRSILDAMKSFAADENPIDIEEAAILCKGDCQSCSHASPFKGRQLIMTGTKVKQPTADHSGVMRFKPSSIQAALALLDKYKDFGVQLVAGDTGKGVFKYEKQMPYLIDIMAIPDLYIVSSNSIFVTVGSAVSLSNFIVELEKFQQQNMSKGEKLGKLAQHLKRIANVPVRNVGTWAGNLMLAHIHANFPSDVCTIMQTAGAELNIVGSNGMQKCSIQEFLQVDMTGKIIVNVEIPFDQPTEHFLTFKIMPRHVNARAYVNAGFRLGTTTATSKTVGSTVVIVYGGIGPHTTEALNTEKYLVGKDLREQATLSSAMSVLSSEINPDSRPAAASAEYRKSLALSLFYKFYLSILGSDASPRLHSAPSTIYRPVSSGTQQYSSDPSRYPLTKPMTKLAAKMQTSGEAEYVDDIPLYPNEVRGAFIISTQANAKLVSLDTSAALGMPGVLCCIGAEDIPPGGINNFCARGVPEPVFATDYIAYAGQPIGMVIADTQAHADAAAFAVTAKYEQEKKPILTIKDAIAANSLYPESLAPLIAGQGDPVDALKASKHVISGEISCGYQYPFHMETQCCLTVPTDCGLEVYSATQAKNTCQDSIAHVLGLKNSSVNISVKRLGGSFGGKIKDSQLVAVGASLAAYKLNRPVRVVLTLDTNTQMMGCRPSWLAQYQVGFDDCGKLNAIVLTAYYDSGAFKNISCTHECQNNFDNAYYTPHWKVSVRGCKTDTPTQIPVRGPGIKEKQC